MTSESVDGRKTESRHIESESQRTIRGRIVDLRKNGVILFCNGRYLRVNGCPDECRRGDIISMSCRETGDSLQYLSHDLLVRPAEDPLGLKKSVFSHLSRRREVLEARHIMMITIRDFFEKNGFLEIQTPTLVPSPGLEPTLGFFETTYTDESGKEHTYTLPTSPEFALKKVLTAGYDQIYEIKNVFRNYGECGAAHHPEFTMLEWYRAFSDYTGIMSDVEQLFKTVARVLCTEMTSSFRDRTIRWEPPYQRMSVCELWRDMLDIDLSDVLSTPFGIRRKCAAILPNSISESESEMNLFHRIMVEYIEPKIGLDRPIIVYDYPSELAALSIIRKDNPAFCERFEVYVGGMELANAFTEVNDPREMAIRIRKDRSEQRENGLPVMPADGALLRAMRQGMPPAAGIAMGLDRLLMALCGINSIRESLTFSLDIIPDELHRLPPLS